MVVGTGKHKLRVYETKARRPALQLAWGQARITALAAEPDGKGCLRTRKPMM